MLGQWRIVLKQAEEAGRAGRLDEALALATRADVAGFRQAIQLQSRLTVELVDRALRRAEAHDLEGAATDLELAERHQAAPDLLATARHKLADQLAEDLLVDFEAGDSARVLDAVGRWNRRKVNGPALRRLGEAADSWQNVLAELRRGEFGAAREQLERAERLAGPKAAGALASLRRELESRQNAAVPRTDKLYDAIAGGQWNTILAAAESVLDLVPEHAAARQARSQAWRQIGALNAAPGLYRRNEGFRIVNPAARERQAPANPEPANSPSGRPRRFLLWADTVGGYLVCLEPELVLGRAAIDGHADIPLLGDLSRRHATIKRSGGGYVLLAHHETYVNGKPIEEAPLRHGDVIRLGSAVELEFRQPSPVSTTARLVILSRHRLPMSVDGIILMGETCILGPSNQAHIHAPALANPVVLVRQNADIWVRSNGQFEVDGKAVSGRAQLRERSSVLGEGFSFSLEPLTETPARA